MNLDDTKVDAGPRDDVPPQEPHPPGHQAHDAPPQGAWQPPAGSPVPPQPGAEATSNDERTWALFAHLSALAGLFVPAGQILGPLIVWILKKDQSRFVDHQGKEAVNFQITMLILVAVSGVVAVAGTLLAIILVGIPFLIVGWIGVAVFYLLSLVFAIVGGVKANGGEWYRYPFSWRFIR